MKLFLSCSKTLVSLPIHGKSEAKEKSALNAIIFLLSPLAHDVVTEEIVSETFQGNRNKQT